LACLLILLVVVVFGEKVSLVVGGVVCFIFPLPSRSFFSLLLLSNSIFSKRFTINRLSASNIVTTPTHPTNEPGQSEETSNRHE
jgi:hypothetical protein